MAIVASLLASIADPSNAREVEIPVPSDPNARYYLLNLVPMDGATLQIESRREGTSGISFSVRLVDCAAGTYDAIYSAYDGEPRSEVFPILDASPNMGLLTDQSISWYVSRFACTKLGMAMGW